MGILKEIKSGTKFHKWTVLHLHALGRNAIWWCQCDCGGQAAISGTKLRSGRSKQCNRCSGRVNGKKGHKPKQHLYMIQCGPYIKIGVTDNIKVRLTTIQASNPYEIKLVGFWKDYGYKEKEWHEHLKEYHVRGEWFKLPSAGVCEL